MGQVILASWVNQHAIPLKRPFPLIAVVLVMAYPGPWLFYIYYVMQIIPDENKYGRPCNDWLVRGGRYLEAYLIVLIHL